MPDLIPFTPSDNNYRIRVPISTAHYLFDVYWNVRDTAWYFDLRNDDETVIVLGVKIVLGVDGLGALSGDPFFDEHKLIAVDSSGFDLDAGYDDLGARITVFHQTKDDLQFGIFATQT